jgi:lipopolysaccharide/colanic/teichoic acid biosynthesis glycosyltransferase
MNPNPESPTTKERHKPEAPLLKTPLPVRHKPPARGQLFEIPNIGELREAPAADKEEAARERPLVDPEVAAAFARELAEAGLDGKERRSLIWAASRLADIAIASAALILTSPIILLMIVAVRLDSPGPALFAQRRVGKRLKPFTLLKMRTLYVDARERFPELYRYQFSPTEIKTLALSDLKAPDDPRVTRLGRWLRKSSLDELPNFWNVLKGDIALVGPRPELFECLKYYQGPQLLKFAVRPGLTGLAQVSGRNSNSFQQMIHLDVDYVRNRNLFLDVWITLLTVKAVLSRNGAW